MKTYSKQMYVGIVSGVMFNLNRAQIQNFLTSIWLKGLQKLDKNFQAILLHKSSKLSFEMKQIRKRTSRYVDGKQEYRWPTSIIFQYKSPGVFYEKKFDGPLRLWRVLNLPKMALSMSLFCLDSIIFRVSLSQCHHKIPYPSTGSSLGRWAEIITCDMNQVKYTCKRLPVFIRKFCAQVYW